MGLRKTVFFIPFLLVACGGQRVDAPVSELAAARAEILELQAELKEQSEGRESSAESVSKAELSESVLSSRDVPLTGLSQGPCGVFRIAGSEILQLEYENTQGPYRWVGTGLDYLEMLHDLYGEPWPEATWLQRSADVVLGFQVENNGNHLFFAQWWTSLVSFEEDGPDAMSNDVSGILGASTVSYGGFLGLDKSCRWGWVPIRSGSGSGSSAYVINSSVEMESGWDSDRAFREFYWKDYSCDGGPPWGSVAVYDSKAHMFVSECKYGD